MDPRPLGNDQSSTNPDNPPDYATAITQQINSVPRNGSSGVLKSLRRRWRRSHPPGPRRTSTGSTDTSSTTSQRAKGPAFPKAMLSRFSLYGEAVWIWEKNQIFLVRYLPDQDTEDVVARGPDDGIANRRERSSRIVTLAKGDIVCDVAEAQGKIAIAASRPGTDTGSVLVAIDSARLQQQPNDRSHMKETPLKREDRPSPFCMSMSPNGRLLAVGFGEEAVLVTRRDVGQESVWSVSSFPVVKPSAPLHVEFQSCNFSPDSSSLVLSTQLKSKGAIHPQDNYVYTSFWPTSGPPIDATRQRLPSCQIPTERIGLTTVHYYPPERTAFVTAYTDYPVYDVFLTAPQTTSRAPPGTHLKIRCAAAWGNFVYFVDSANNISYADMRAKTILPIAPTWREKVKNEMKRGHEIISMAVTNTTPPLIRLLCLLQTKQRIWFLQTPVGEDDNPEGFIHREITYLFEKA